MTPIVTKWLTDNGLIVKSEFGTPWGICDLVAASLSSDHVALRLRHKQTGMVSSIIRAAILLQVPDVESGKSITHKRLALKFDRAVSEEQFSLELNRLIRDRFIKESSRQRLQKVNGWMPLHRRLVAVELKLSRVEEAMQQAMNNFAFSDESYVGFPSRLAERIVNHREKWMRFISSGVGLLSVEERKCSVLIRSSGGQFLHNPALQLLSVERFWNSHLKAMKHEGLND